MANEVDVLKLEKAIDALAAAVREMGTLCAALQREIAAIKRSQPGKGARKARGGKGRAK